MGQNSGLLSSLTDWNSTLAGYADSISTGVVMPVALTLLALFMILELYNATQRIAMNGSNNAFTIQQIALVMLKIVVCRWAVVHTDSSASLGRFPALLHRAYSTTYSVFLTVIYILSITIISLIIISISFV